MTQRVKKTNPQRPVPRTVGTTYGLSDLFGGDQQAYAHLPAARVIGPYGLSGFAIQDFEMPTTQASSAAWIAQNLAAVHPAALAPQPESMQPGAMSAVYQSAGEIVLPVLSFYNLPASPFLVQGPGEGAAVAAMNTPDKFDISHAFPLSWNLALERARGVVLVHGNYEGIVVFQGGTMSTQDALILPGEETAEQLIWKSVASLRITERGRLAEALFDLQKAIRDEEDASCLGISISSLRNFLDFIQANQRLRLPVISATPEGNVYASWRGVSGEVFSIHFLSENQVRFVIFRPNSKHPAETIRISGNATSDVVLEIGEPHGVLGWTLR